MKLSTKASNVAGLVRLLKPHQSRIAILGLTSLLAGILEALFLVSVTRTALSLSNPDETITLIGDLELSVAMALSVAGIAVSLRLAISLLGILVYTSLAKTVAINTREQLASSFLGSSWPLQQSEPAGKLQQLLLGFTFQVTNLVNVAGTALTAFLTLLVLLAIATVVDPIAMIVVCFALASFAVVLSPIRHRLGTRAEILANEELSFSSKVSELGPLGLEIQSFGIHQRVLDHLRPFSRREAQARQRVEILAQTSIPVYISFAYAVVVISLAAIALLDISEFTSTSAVMLIMLRSLIYGQQLQQSASILAEKAPFLQSLEDARLRYVAGRHERGDVVVRTLDSIQLNDLWFAYRDRIPALSDLSLNISAGEIVGIVGPSGSGKSTLVEILLGLRIPDRGTVLVNDHDLQSITHESWSAISAFVPQETALITGTISENIRFFRQNISDEDVIRAAQHAFIDSDIRGLPEGYESWIGERGAELSGGQRQRLAIARAIVGSPQLLILDEPTSALDDRSEGMIREALSELSRSTTVVVVAHRMSTLSVCDRILVLQDGKKLVFDKTSRVLDPEHGYASGLAFSEID